MDKVTLCYKCQVTSGVQIVMNGVPLSCIHTEEHAQETIDLWLFKGHSDHYIKNDFLTRPAQLPEPQQLSNYSQSSSGAYSLAEHSQESA